MTWRLRWNRIAILALAITAGLIARAERPAAAAPCTADQQCRLIISPEPVTISAPSGVSNTTDAHVTNHSAAAMSNWTFTLSGPFTFDAPCSPGSTTCSLTAAPPVPVGGEFTPHPVIRCTANDTTQMGTFMVTADGHTTMVDALCVGSPGMAAELDYDPIAPMTSHVGTPTTATLHVRNLGTGALSYQLMRSGTAAGDFTLSSCDGTPCSIAVGGPQQSITVTFTPSDIFDRSIDLVVMSNDPDEGTVTIPITATGTAGRIAVIAPPVPPLDFGQVPNGIQTSPRTITVKNVGNEMLSAVDGSITAGATDYQTPPGAPVVLMPNQTRDFDVSCRPSGLGPHPGTFTVDAPTAVPDATVDIALTCEGIASQLEISPASFAYDRIRVGTSAPPTTITVINHGSAPVTLGAAQITPADASYVLTGAPDGTGSLAASGGMMTFQVTFTPATHAAHDVSITGIDTSDPGHVVTLTGRGVIADYVLDPAVTAVDLGTACRGTPVSRELSLTAIGDATLAVDVGLESGTDYTMTMVQPGTTPLVLDPEQAGMATATVRIDVTALDVPVTDRLIWTTDRTAGDTTAVDLTLMGIASGLAASPGAIDFGTIAPAATSDQAITTQLCDPGGSDVTATLDGDAAFTLIGTPTAHVDLTQSTPWRVQFTPPARGSYDATLHLVPATGSEVTIAVHGEADDVGPGDDDTGGLTDYYNCGCSGETSGVGGAMILLVVAWQHQHRRRRRRAVRR